MPVAVNGRKLMNTPFGMSNLENLKVQLSMSKLENLEEENQNLIPQEVNKLINIHIYSFRLFAIYIKLHGLTLAKQVGPKVFWDADRFVFKFLSFHHQLFLEDRTLNISFLLKHWRRQFWLKNLSASQQTFGPSRFVRALEECIYRTRAIITRSWLQTALKY